MTTQTIGMTKTTFTLKAQTYERFIELIHTLGLRRNKYLGNVLDSAIDLLEVHEPNSKEAARWLREGYDPDLLICESEPVTRVGLSLDKELLARLNATCREKRVPRDMFMNELINYAIAALNKAKENLEDPHGIQDYLYGDDRHYSRLFLSEDGLIQAREEQEQFLELAEAIASLHKINSVSAAQRELAKLSALQREQLRSNPEVNAELERLRNLEPVDLDFSSYLNGHDTSIPVPQEESA